MIDSHHFEDFGIFGPPEMLLFPQGVETAMGLGQGEILSR